VQTPQDVALSQTAQSVSVDCNKTPDHPKCQKVVVTQGYIDDATKAFDLVVAQRDAIDALIKTKNLQGEERKAWELVRNALNDVISVKDKIISSYEQLVATQQKVIAMYSGLVEKMQLEIGKKKGFWDKVLDTVKVIGYILTGVALGHGI
jgi:threonine dehydratase